jgi:hypothetical protein
MLKAFIQKLKDMMKKLGTKLSCKRCTPASDMKHKGAV